MKEKEPKIDFAPYLIIFAVSIILLSPLLSSNYIWGHDSMFHISNTMALKETLSGGDWLFPKILPIIANDFGYGTEIFYGPITHGSTAILSFIIDFIHEISLLNVMKIIHFLALFLSGIFMYQFVLKITKKKYIAILSAIIYLTFPYRTSEIYIRDAQAESLTFIFLPLIFNGLYELLFLENKKKFYLLFILGVVLLILTHLITTLFTAFLVIIFLLINYKRVFQKKNIIPLFISLGFILLLTSFYTVPLLEQKLFANINIFSSNVASTIDSVSNNALGISKLFPFLNNKSSDGIVFFILIPTIMLLLFSIINYHKIKHEHKKIFLQFFILGSISLWMSTNLFPWKIVPDIFLYIQFPWRMLVFAIFFLSIAAIFFMISLKDELQKLASYFLIILLVISAMSSLNLERVVSYSERDIDISEFGVGAVKDYFPVRVIENYEYFENRSDDPIIIRGEGIIEIEKKSTPYITFLSNIKSDKVLVEFPLLYYYGYKAECPLVTDEPFKVTMSENGFVLVEVDKNCGATLSFTGSKLTSYANSISIFSFVFYFVFLVRGKKDERES